MFYDLSLIPLHSARFRSIWACKNMFSGFKPDSRDRKHSLDPIRGPRRRLNRLLGGKTARTRFTGPKYRSNPIHGAQNNAQPRFTGLRNRLNPTRGGQTSTPTQASRISTRTPKTPPWTSPQGPPGHQLALWERLFRTSPGALGTPTAGPWGEEGEGQDTHWLPRDTRRGGGGDLPAPFSNT